MEAPKCKICGERHYSLCRVATLNTGQANREAILNSLRIEPPKPTFDRTAYQREYMRKRRAAQKAEA